MVPFRRWLAGLLILLAPALGGRARAAPPRIAVLPVEVYNAPDLAPLAPGLQAMLASRLDGQGYTVDVAGEPGDATWVVRTTITRLGGTYSLDVALEPGPSNPAEGTRAYRTADRPDAILPALEAVAGALRTHLAAATPEPPASVKRPLPSAPPSEPAPTPQPERPPGRGAVGSPTRLEDVLRAHRPGPVHEGEALGLVVADLDADGDPEIVVLTADALVAFHDANGGLRKLWEVPTPRGIRPAALSAADLDGNGRPELFVAGMNETHPVSQALEWFGSALASKGPRFAGFVRAVRSAPDPVVLAVLPGAGSDLFAPGFKQVVWNGSRYEADGPFRAPEAAVPVNLDLLPLDPAKPPFFVVTTQDDRLQIYNHQGRRLYESADPVKGSRVFLRGEERVRDHQDEDFYRVQGRTVLWRGPDGGPYLVLYRNHASLGRIFQRVGGFSHGQMLVYQWDGLTLLPVAEGPKIPGMIADIDLYRANGRSVLYAALVQTEGTLFKKRRFRVLAYSFPSPGH